MYGYVRPFLHSAYQACYVVVWSGLAWCAVVWYGAVCMHHVCVYVGMSRFSRALADAAW